MADGKPGRRRQFAQNSTTVTARLDPDRLHLFEAIVNARGFQHRTEAVLEAIDEYVDRHSQEAGFTIQEELFDIAG